MNEVLKCPHCQKCFINSGVVNCPYCGKDVTQQPNMSNIIDDLFGNIFKGPKH